MTQKYQNFRCQVKRTCPKSPTLPYVLNFCEIYFPKEVGKNSEMSKIFFSSYFKLNCVTIDFLKRPRSRFFAKIYYLDEKLVNYPKEIFGKFLDFIF
jgi:hypothetical protein